MNAKKISALRLPNLLLLLSFLIAWGIVQVVYVGFGRGEIDHNSDPTSYNSSHIMDPRVTDDTLLIESIVAIVQNYYIDRERVTNQELLDLTLSRLSDNRVVSYSKVDNLYMVKNEDMSFEFHVDKNYRLKDFVQHIIGVSNVIAGERVNKENSGFHEGRFVFLNSLLAGLDPHSSLLDRFLYKELRQGTEGSFGGLGVVVGIKENLLTVIKPIPNSPAARAGIKKRDKIIMINNTSTYGATLENLVEHMRGEPGTKVNLSLMRGGAYAPTNISLEREVIEVDSVTSYLEMRNKHKFIRIAIEGFSSRTSHEVRDAIMRHERDSDLSGIVLDLRGNPGGLLDQAVSVSDLFLTKGDIVSTKGRRLEVEKAGVGFYEFRHPMIVLINSDSASASEIVAGALRENNRAIVIGQPSFGKGSVQTIFELPQEQALKLTIARYYTPAGISIQGRGIMPDLLLQPIVRSRKNLNLMGEYRYRTERFLMNSLKSDGIRSGLRGASHVGFYLVDEITDTPLDADRSNDIELAIAYDLLEKVASDYGVPASVSSARVSHYLGRYFSFLKNRVDDSTRKVTTWLRQQHDIDWSVAREDKIGPSLSEIKLELSLPNSLVLGKDNSIKTDWKIVNNSKSAIERLSIFVQVKGSVSHTAEFLVGKVNAGETSQGVVHIPVFNDEGVRDISLKSGLSQNGSPILFNGKSRTVEVIPAPLPSVKLITELIEGNNSIFKGMLEAKEKAILRVSVKNDGQETGNGLGIRVANLAGRQIRIENDDLFVGDLKPGESKNVDFEVVASPTLLSNELGFGVSIEGENMISVIRKRVSIPAKKNVNTEKPASMLGH